MHLIFIFCFLLLFFGGCLVNGHYNEKGENHHNSALSWFTNDRANSFGLSYSDQVNFNSYLLDSISQLMVWLNCESLLSNRAIISLEPQEVEAVTEWTRVEMLHNMKSDLQTPHPAANRTREISVLKDYFIVSDSEELGHTLDVILKLKNEMLLCMGEKQQTSLDLPSLGDSLDDATIAKLQDVEAEKLMFLMALNARRRCLFLLWRHAYGDKKCSAACTKSDGLNELNEVVCTEPNASTECNNVNCFKGVVEDGDWLELLRPDIKEPQP